MTHVLAISNNKGGVAKTTTCMSLGAALAELGQRTLLVDLDPQSDLTLAAGLDADGLERSVADLLDPAGAPPAIPRLVQPTAADGLDILPSAPRLAGVERALYERDGYETTLAEALAAWQADYAYILLDCPPSLGGLTLMALTAARWAIIPVQCEYYAARRLGRLFDVIEIVRARTNPALTCYLLATMYDQRNRICRGVLEQLRQTFSDQMLESIISVDTRLRESPVVGEPITVYAPGSRASQQYRQAAQELHAKLTPLCSRP